MSQSNGTRPKAELSAHGQEQFRRWGALKSHLQEWYAEPDLQCLRACAAIYASHFSQESPIWMFILGPPSVGKTELMINPLTKLPLTHILSSITDSAFISNFNEKAGILRSLDRHNGTQSGVLLFPDFSNFLALQADTRTALQAQLREIYDGSYRKHCGTRPKPITWEGKVTILAACTLELERYWGLEAALGDRFLQIKLNKQSNELITHFQEKQLAYGPKKIQAETTKLLQQFMQFIDESPDPEMPKEITSKFMPLVDVCLSLRQNTSRNFRGEIQHLSPKDGPARFLKMIYNLARYHAKLFGLPAIMDKEYHLCKRVIIDTIPSARLTLARILLGSDVMLTTKDIANSTTEYANNKAIYRIVEEFEALRLITTQWEGKTKYIALAPHFREELLTAEIPSLAPNLTSNDYSSTVVY